MIFEMPVYHIIGIYFVGTIVRNDFHSVAADDEEEEKYSYLIIIILHICTQTLGPRNVLVLRYKKRNFDWPSYDVIIT